MTFGYPVSSSDAQASLHRLAGQAKPDRDDQAQPARTHPPLSCPLLLTLSHLGSTCATNAQNVRSCSLPRCDHIRHGCTLGHAVSRQEASARHRACGRVRAFTGGQGERPWRALLVERTRRDRRKVCRVLPRTQRARRVARQTVPTHSRMRTQRSSSMRCTVEYRRVL